MGHDSKHFLQSFKMLWFKSTWWRPSQQPEKSSVSTSQSLSARSATYIMKHKLPFQLHTHPMIWIITVTAVYPKSIQEKCRQSCPFIPGTETSMLHTQRHQQTWATILQTKHMKTLSWRWLDSQTTVSAPHVQPGNKCIVRYLQITTHFQCQDTHSGDCV